MHHPEGVFHVTDDVLLLAQAAVGAVSVFPAHRAAEQVRGFVLQNVCRYYEFRVRSVDASQQRIRMEAAIIHTEKCREFWGFNRGKHAVIEAAILATRLHLLPPEEVESEYKKLRVIVEKTGGPAEIAAMTFLESYRERSA
jgi:hypothetical protein